MRSIKDISASSGNKDRQNIIMQQNLPFGTDDKQNGSISSTGSNLYLVMKVMVVIKALLRKKR